ncbi:MAG: YdcF family protein [Lachnospiraceae bacterium]|nr:YdcF family protein [Lachnospiraceae bacterium]
MRKLRRKIIVITIIIMVVVYIVINVASICIYSTKDEKCKADVAIVLGAAAYEGEVSPVYRERINHGITLYKEGFVEKIIVTGGIGEGNVKSDAYYAKEYAISMGVLAEDVLTEDTSTITEENLENAKLIMEQKGYETAIIVSDPLHMKRAMLLAKDAGIEGYSSPTPTTRYQSLKTKIPFVAREVFFYVGYKWYRIFE